MDLPNKTVAIVVATAMVAAYLALVPLTAQSDNDQSGTQSVTALDPRESPRAESVRTLTAMVTGYNTVASQTDDTPCIAAGGNICGRRDTVACPSSLPLHSWVSIDGKKYECMDRTADKFNGRFDISCDKDMKCPYAITGRRTVIVLK